VDIVKRLAVTQQRFSCRVMAVPDYDANISDEMRLAALARPELAQVDLILCGHAPGPHVQVEYLPNGRQVLAIRASGWPNLGDGRRRTSVASAQFVMRVLKKPSSLYLAYGNDSSIFDPYLVQ
jgi:hypothetical protein